MRGTVTESRSLLTTEDTEDAEEMKNDKCRIRNHAGPRDCLEGDVDSSFFILHFSFPSSAIKSFPHR